MDRWTHERALWARGQVVVGLDEVGTGAWAGPVVAGAVVLPPAAIEVPDGPWHEIDDSKRLSPPRRERLAAWIRDEARGVGLGWVGVEEIESLGVYRASLLAMERALVEVSGLGPSHLLVDARSLPSFRGDQTALVGGDGRSASIGAASIVAKVARDAFMVEQAQRHPGYGFERHKGYGTAVHRAALAALGPSALHRPRFLPSVSDQLSLGLG